MEILDHGVRDARQIKEKEEKRKRKKPGEECTMGPRMWRWHCSTLASAPRRAMMMMMRMPAWVVPRVASGLWQERSAR